MQRYLDNLSDGAWPCLQILSGDQQWGGIGDHWDCCWSLQWLLPTCGIEMGRCTLVIVSTARELQKVEERLAGWRLFFSKLIIQSRFKASEAF